MTAPDPSAVKVAGGTFHYLLIDGTDAIDSAVFGQALEKAGKGAWKNLLDALPDSTATGETGRKVDAAHDFLPVWKVKPTNAGASDILMGSTPDTKTGVCVVQPQGLNSRGDQEPWWQNYNGGTPQTFPVTDDVLLQLHAQPKRLVGRQIAIQKSCQFMEPLMLNPAIKVAGGKAEIVDDPDDSDATIVRADLISVSSHGWLGGFMAGNGGMDWAAAQPPEAQAAYHGGKFFVVGRVAKDSTRIFQGVRWLIMAQCSTVCSSTWPMWASIFARSKPPVRGIIAYEEVAPGPGTASAIAKNFFANVAAGQSFLEAWKAANNGNNWAALIHETAVGDGFTNFGTWGSADLKPNDPATRDHYVGFLHSTGGTATKVDLNAQPPFSFDLGQAFHFHRDATAAGAAAIDRDIDVTIEPEKLDQLAATLWGKQSFLQNLRYWVKVAPSRAGDTIKEVRLEWIHIRPTKDRINMKKIFDVANVAVEGDVATARLVGPATFVVTPKSGQTPSSITVDFPMLDTAALKSLEGTDDHHIEAHHSYFWLRVSLTTAAAAKALTFDFTTKGLLYYGS